MSFRVGIGWDRHRLQAGSGIRLAGKRIPSEVEAIGHSDADAALHAVIDAQLGAAGLGDIGKHFPPEEERWADVDSVDLLGKATEKVRANGWQTVNLDLIISLEEIKLNPHREEMKKKLEEEVSAAEAINLKFKTGEGLGPVGRGEAVEARAVVLMKET